jgi:hypothetical protein
MENEGLLASSTLEIFKARISTVVEPWPINDRKICAFCGAARKDWPGCDVCEPK